MNRFQKMSAKLVTLTTIMSSCTPIPIPPYQESSESKGAASQPASKPSTIYKFVFTPLEKYDPVVKRKRVQISNTLRQSLEYGLDYGIENDNLQEDRVKIDGFVQFEQLLYKEAEKLGHTKEEVIDFSPREVVELCNKIIGKRVNYFGILYTSQEKTKRDATVKRLKLGLEQVLIDPTAQPEHKKDATEKLEVMKQLEDAIKKQDECEEKLSSANFFLSDKQDNEPIDIILGKRDSIICRNYARIAKGIFFVLQTKNQKLQNTYMAMYTGNVPKLNNQVGRHCWNQIATVWEDGNRVIVDITFSDPTWYDGSGDGEGYDARHFWKTGKLTEQLNELQKRLGEEQQPRSKPTSQPVTKQK